jgi:hypothetical protein
MKFQAMRSKIILLLISFFLSCNENAKENFELRERSSLRILRELDKFNF